MLFKKAVCKSVYSSRRSSKSWHSQRDSPCAYGHHHGMVSVSPVVQRLQHLHVQGEGLRPSPELLRGIPCALNVVEDVHLGVVHTVRR